MVDGEEMERWMEKKKGKAMFKEERESKNLKICSKNIPSKLS